MITYLHNLLKDCGWKGLSLATDINSKAASLASKTARENGVSLVHFPLLMLFWYYVFRQQEYLVVSTLSLHDRSGISDN